MISFDHSIYLKDAILQACRDYKDLAEFKTSERNGRIICDIIHAEADPELVENEFGNYVLNLTVMMGGAKL